MKTIVPIFLLTVLLAACAGPASNSAVTQLPALSSGAKPVNLTQTPYPQPVIVTPVPTLSSYPEPVAPAPTSTPPGKVVIPPTGYEPQPGDASLKRDQVFLDMAGTKLVTNGSNPVQASVSLVGDLPDPCHQLRVVITGPNEINAINMEVYSVVDPSTACITVLKPFEATLKLGSFPTGHYTVYVNEQLLGEFDS